MTPEFIHSTINVLVINKDSADLMTRRGVDPLDVLKIGELAARAAELEKENQNLREKIAELRAYIASSNDLIGGRL